MVCSGDVTSWGIAVTFRENGAYECCNKKSVLRVIACALRPLQRRTRVGSDQPAVHVGFIVEWGPDHPGRKF